MQNNDSSRMKKISKKGDGTVWKRRKVRGRELVEKNKLMRLFVIHDKMNELRMHEIRFNLSHNIKKTSEFLPTFICTVCLRSSFDSRKLCYLHISFGLSIWVWWNGWSFIIIIDSSVVVGVNQRKVFLCCFFLSLPTSQIQNTVKLFLCKNMI